MDPFSVALAATGLASSLITILDTTIQISKKLAELRVRIKNAPKRINQLHGDLQHLHALVEAIRERLPNSGSIHFQPILASIYSGFFSGLEQDLKELQGIVNRVNIRSKIPFSHNVLVRARHIKAESAIKESHERILKHLAMNNRCKAPCLQATSDIASGLTQDTSEILTHVKMLSHSLLEHRQTPKTICSRGRDSAAVHCMPPTCIQETHSTSLTESFEERRTYYFVLGLFTFQTFRNPTAQGDDRSLDRESVELRISFLPPSWISSTAL